MPRMRWRIRKNRFQSRAKTCPSQKAAASMQGLRPNLLWGRLPSGFTKVIEMPEVEVKNIRLTSFWWKLFHFSPNNIEVDLYDESGSHKSITIYHSEPFVETLIRDYIRAKYCTGDQFCKSRKLNKKEILQMDLDKVIGFRFQCDEKTFELCVKGD